MNKLLIVAAAALVNAVAATPLLAADVGVSINVGEPGFYGRLDVGDFPRPQVIYQRPRMVQHLPRGEVREPLYLHVPPGHERHWSRHCAQYNACGQPVYFVRDRWYQDTYVSRYRERNRHNDHGYDHGDRGNDHGDHDYGHDHDQGHDRDRDGDPGRNQNQPQH